MKYLILFSVLWLLYIAAASAQRPTYPLTGIITMSTGEEFPFRLTFTEASGVVTGHSYTYHEEIQSKAVIKGTLDRNRRILRFKEVEIVESHNVRTRAFMCLADAVLEYVQGPRGRLFTGPLTSKEADNTACTAGTITFADAKELQRLFNNEEVVDSVFSFKRKSKEAAPANTVSEPTALATLPAQKITTGIEKSLDWNTDSLVVDVWDGGTIDGDRVTLELDGKPVLQNYFLVKDKKQIRLPLTGTGTHTLAIVADTEGSEPPNTARVLLTDGSKQHHLEAYDNKGDKALIKITRTHK